MKTNIHRRQDHHKAVGQARLSVSCIHRDRLTSGPAGLEATTEDALDDDDTIEDSSDQDKATYMTEDDLFDEALDDELTEDCDEDDDDTKSLRKICRRRHVNIPSPLK